MSIPQDSQWRGCAANFPPPVNPTDMLAAQSLVEAVYHFNCRTPESPLDDILYRSNSSQYDVAHHVFRWDHTPIDEIFQNGFQAWRQGDIPDELYFNLDDHVHHSGRPGDPNRRSTHAFISTTISSAWHPSLNSDHTEDECYRYEIYAPGGIWVGQTFGDRYQFTTQDEVCFVGGIAPQYVHAAQRFRLIYDSRGYTRRERVDNILTLNGNFNPHRFQPGLTIQRPVNDYMDENGRRMNLHKVIKQYNANLQREKRQVSIDSATTDWYVVANSESYIDAAFRSSRTNEAYLFMKNEYVLLNYAPGTTGDKIVNGPLLICDGYPSLRDTAFGEYGIDCAFRSSWEEEAFIFSGNLCAVIIYAPGTTDDKIKKGPMTIIAMFPFLKGTVFERGIDAAFESTREPEAYIFKGNQYALINYGPDCHLIGLRLITEGFPSLRSTIFESGIDAAFASHRNNEAYIFKGDSYALINFAPDSTDDYIIGGVKKILPNWPSLLSILPRENGDLDIHDHSTTAGGHHHDEL